VLPLSHGGIPTERSMLGRGYVLRFGFWDGDGAASGIGFGAVVEGSCCA
jgi:hypothetical protein